MSGGGVLALDLATQTGWAHATPEAVDSWPDDLPGSRGPVDGVTYGTWTLGKPGDPAAKRWLKLNDLLTDKLERISVGIICFEAPIPSGPAVRGPIARMLHGFAVIAEACAFVHNNTPVFEEYPSTVKKWATGHGAATKIAIIDKAITRGWDPETEDEADALALLDMTVMQYRAGNISYFIKAPRSI